MEGTFRVTYRERDIVIPMKQAIFVCYTNHEGKTAWRWILPLPVPPEFGSPYHPNQWIIRVWDLDKDGERSYAIGSMHMIVNHEQYNKLTDGQRQTIVCQMRAAHVLPKE